MLYSEIIAVCSEIHTKHTNVEFFNLNLVVRIVTTASERVDLFSAFPGETRKKKLK
jgi:hypothetical protein